MRSGCCVLLLVTSVLLTRDQACSAAEADMRPNLVLAIADDWSWLHAGAYGDPVVKTPTFDRIAREGALFKNAYCASPSCTPSRASILTGHAVHRLGPGGNLWSYLPGSFVTYPDRLEENGYHVGHTGKGWGPGTLEASGRGRNPAGPRFKSARDFLAAVPADKPFCFWFGSMNPHRPYEPGSGLKAGLKPDRVKVPGFLPDMPEVREDLLDYYEEVQRFDRELADLVQLLEERGELDKTLLIVTADNGMPFPRAKANLYDYGARVPLAVRWPSKVPAGTVVDEFVSLTDLCVTMLEAAGERASTEQTGQSLLSLLSGKPEPARNRVFLERERHANVRAGNRSYPMRAVRTKDFLYVRNLASQLWPAGDPELWHSVGPFGDVDDSPTKQLILRSRGDGDAMQPFFKLAFDKRPAEELYDLRNDPDQLKNVAGQQAYAAAQGDLRRQLDQWMRDTADPRASEEASTAWDEYPYTGERFKPDAAGKNPRRANKRQPAP